MTPWAHRDSLGLNKLNPGTALENCTLGEDYCVVGRVALYQGFGIEFVTTLVLLLVVLSVTDSGRRGVSELQHVLPPMAVGLTVAVCHLLAIPFTGCGINPARSLGWYTGCEGEFVGTGAFFFSENYTYLSKFRCLRAQFFTFTM